MCISTFQAFSPCGSGVGSLCVCGTKGFHHLPTSLHSSAFMFELLTLPHTPATYPFPTFSFLLAVAGRKRKSGRGRRFGLPAFSCLHTTLPSHLYTHIQTSPTTVRTMRALFILFYTTAHVLVSHSPPLCHLRLLVLFCARCFLCCVVAGLRTHALRDAALLRTAPLSLLSAFAFLLLRVTLHARLLRCTFSIFVHFLRTVRYTFCRSFSCARTRYLLSHFTVRTPPLLPAVTHYRWCIDLPCPHARDLGAHFVRLPVFYHHIFSLLLPPPVLVQFPLGMVGVVLLLSAHLQCSPTAHHHCSFLPHFSCTVFLLCLTTRASTHCNSFAFAHTTTLFFLQVLHVPQFTTYTHTTAFHYLPRWCSHSTPTTTILPPQTHTHTSCLLGFSFLHAYFHYLLFTQGFLTGAVPTHLPASHLHASLPCHCFFSTPALLLACPAFLQVPAGTSLLSHCSTCFLLHCTHTPATVLLPTDYLPHRLLLSPSLPAHVSLHFAVLHTFLYLHWVLFLHL